MLIKIKFSFFLIVFFINGCALSSDSSSTERPIVKQCIVPADQTGTISGRWQTSPIPIAFHQNDFANTELNAMTSAADIWNAFFNKSKNKQIFNYGNSRNPTLSSGENPRLRGALCSNGILQGQSFSGNIVIYKLGVWPSNYPASAIALTSFCTLSAQPYPNMYMAIMELNYQRFFVQGAKLPDLQSIALHELGHVIGLNHTCEAAPKIGTPNCNDPNLNPNYALASMYPVFSFDAYGNGQQKRSLGTNDESRANCLY